MVWQGKNKGGGNFIQPPKFFFSPCLTIFPLNSDIDCIQWLFYAVLLFKMMHSAILKEQLRYLNNKS